MLLLALKVARRHAESGEVTKFAYALATKLIRLKTTLVSTAVEGGALELALATLRGMRSCLQAVLPLLALLVGVLHAEHAARAVQLGVVEVRRLVHDVLYFFAIML